MTGHVHFGGGSLPSPALRVLKLSLVMLLIFQLVSHTRFSEYSVRYRYSSQELTGSLRQCPKRHRGKLTAPPGVRTHGMNLLVSMTELWYYYSSTKLANGADATRYIIHVSVKRPKTVMTNSAACTTYYVMYMPSTTYVRNNEASNIEVSLRRRLVPLFSHRRLIHKKQRWTGFMQIVFGEIWQ